MKTTIVLISIILATCVLGDTVTQHSGGQIIHKSDGTSVFLDNGKGWTPTTETRRPVAGTSIPTTITKKRRASSMWTPKIKVDVYGRPVLIQEENKTRGERAGDRNLIVIRGYQSQIKLLETKLERIEILCRDKRFDISAAENDAAWDIYTKAKEKENAKPSAK